MVRPQWCRGPQAPTLIASDSIATSGLASIDLRRRTAERMVAAGRIGKRPPRYSGSSIAPRTAASISAAAWSSDSPGRSLRMSDSSHFSGTAM
jgi:hypothetical protein